MPTRVLMTSTSYPRDLADWKGVFIRNMAGAIAEDRTIDLQLWAPPGDLPKDVGTATTQSESAWLDQLMSSGGVSHLIREGKFSAVWAPLKLLYLLRQCYARQADVDLYHLNWLQCGLPLPANGKPALLTVLGNDLKLMKLPLVRRLLRKVMRHRPVAICPNAEWMLPELQAAFGDIAEVTPVSFGIDPIWYGIERTPALPRRWLAVTRLTANKLGPLFEWSEPLFADGRRELHLFGPMQEETQIPDWVKYHGSASPHQLATSWFPNASGLITLSRHAEGRPQVMLEAMASGLPIIASDMAAHASIVQHGKTGYLCDSPATYTEALLALDDPSINAACGERSRAWAGNEYGTWSDCADRYRSIYRRLLSAPHA